MRTVSLPVEVRLCQRKLTRRGVNRKLGIESVANREHNVEFLRWRWIPVCRLGILKFDASNECGAKRFAGCPGD
jgi:hypothetical protein